MHSVALNLTSSLSGGGGVWCGLPQRLDLRHKHLHPSAGSTQTLPRMLSSGLAFCPCRPFRSQPAHMRNASAGITSDSQPAARAYTCLKAHRKPASSSISWQSSALSRCKCSLPGRTIVRGSPAGAEQPSSSSGSGSSSSSSSSFGQPCALHACLLRHGITDLAAFSAVKHLALSQDAVSSNIEPKLAALAAEGLSPKQIQQLLSAQTTASLLSCSYKATFLPNLQLLQQIGAHTDHRPHPNAPRLTAAGKLLMSSQADAAIYLSRDPSKVQLLLQWLEGSLGVELEQLAACTSLCAALSVSDGAASAVSLLLQQHQVPAGQVVHMLLMQPTPFNYNPELLSARLGTLQQHLDLDAAAALQVAIAYPGLLARKLEARLPPLLRFLDGYMGEVGAGRRLICAQPLLATATAAPVKRSIKLLAVRGYSQRQIQGMISKHPTLLMVNLDSPLQQQKLGWIERESPWTLDDFLARPSYFAVATRRLAARLALLRECGLQPPPYPGSLAVPSNDEKLHEE